MKIDITTVKWKNIGYGKYPFAFKRFKYVKGFIIRFFIIHIRIMENNATEKLITIWNDKREYSSVG